MIIAALALSSCALQTPQPPQNVTDYLARGIYSGATSTADAAKSSDTTVGAYRNTLSRVTFSECKWLPSDSTYYVRTKRTCGSMLAGFLTVARMLEEPQIHDVIPHDPTEHQGRLRWFDAAPTCD